MDFHNKIEESIEKGDVDEKRLGLSLTKILKD